MRSLEVLPLLKMGDVFLVRGGRVIPKDDGISERTVIVEFDSLDSAIAAYESDAYQRALEKLKGTSHIK